MNNIEYTPVAFMSNMFYEEYCPLCKAKTRVVKDRGEGLDVFVKCPACEHYSFEWLIGSFIVKIFDGNKWHKFSTESQANLDRYNLLINRKRIIL